MTVDAAVGNRSILGRGIEKKYLGVPQGAYSYLNFNSVSVARSSVENPSAAITGSDGMDKGTPGDINSAGSIVYDLTVDRLLYDVVAMCGKPISVTALATAKAWLVKLRPNRDNEVRGSSLYLFEGGSYSASLSYGRRVEQLALKDAANKRTEVTAAYTEPTGDTISGFPIAKTGNTGTYAGTMTTRGRRPYDANWTAGKSLFVKVTAINGTTVTVQAQFATAGDGLGGGFPGGAYSSASQVDIVSAATSDGYGSLRDETGALIGLFGENNEPFELTFGDPSEIANLAVGNEFEIPQVMPALAKSVVAENRLSCFHQAWNIDSSTAITFDTADVTLKRPYNVYKANGRRLPTNIDPTGSIEVATTFQERLASRFFREKNDASARFSIYDRYQIKNPITGTTAIEGVEIYLPQNVVSGMKSGDIANKNVLMESITLNAEQPATTPSYIPAGFDGTYTWEINITTPISPVWLD
jgi:hypothetical protein